MSWFSPSHAQPPHLNRPLTSNITVVCLHGAAASTPVSTGSFMIWGCSSPSSTVLSVECRALLATSMSTPTNLRIQCCVTHVSWLWKTFEPCEQLHLPHVRLRCLPALLGLQAAGGLASTGAPGRDGTSRSCSCGVVNYGMRVLSCVQPAGAWTWLGCTHRSGRSENVMNN